MLISVSQITNRLKDLEGSYGIIIRLHIIRIRVLSNNQYTLLLPIDRANIHADNKRVPTHGYLKTDYI